MRDWTEAHIIEVIKDELQRMANEGTTSNSVETEEKDVNDG